VRITGGTLRGRRLVPWEHAGIRPVRDLVRGALFNVLKDFVPQARVLDLFCGTGAVGIEALSRGAKECVFVDVSEEACTIVRRNLDALGLLDQAVVTAADYATGIARLEARARRFDLLFVGAPYHRGLAQRALAELGRGELLGSDPVAITELGRDEALPASFGVLRCVDHRLYGDSALWFYRPAGGDREEDVG
jgi:16S rRNA (guanine966-N2)-methyltransferase